MQNSALLLEKFIKLYGCRPTEFDRRYLELLAMGRYRILDVPDVSPGKCTNCGASRNDGRKYIDTGCHVDWFGQIYFCGHCLREYAEAMGLFDKIKAEYENIKAALLKQDELALMGAQVQDTVLKTFEEMKEFYANLSSVGDNSTPGASPDLELEQAATAESAVIETKPRAAKSTSSTGRKNVSGFTDLLGGQ